MVLSPAPSILPATTKYYLSALLDLGNHTVSVDENIYYMNSTGETLNDFLLAVEPNLWKDCYLPGQIIVNGREVGEATLEGESLTIPFTEPLRSGESLSLYLHFDLRLPQADRYQTFGYNEYQTNLVDWYPFIVPYKFGQGWLVHPAVQVGEHLVYELANIDLTLQLSDPDNSVVIAASSPAEKVPGGLRYHLENGRSFAISASAGFLTASTSIDGVTVTSYFYEGERDQGQMLLTEVAKAISAFDLLFGQLPYSSLSIVESSFFDGMEYSGLFFLSRDYYVDNDGTVLNNMIDIAVHETAHQWWFGSVGNDQALEPWLDEALSTYSEKLFYERNYPDVTAWQAFRIDAYAPAGWVDTDIYHGVDFRTYANAVYLRGAQFLQAIRERVGEQTFFSFMKDYAQAMTGKQATTQDFFRILRFHTRMELADIISEYFQKAY